MLLANKNIVIIGGTSGIGFSAAGVGAVKAMAHLYTWYN